ncbi:MAG: ribonuclease III domain-containing protein [Bacilli bacterium]
MKLKDKNVLVLAYIGDAIYEIYIRKYLINKGINKVNTLQKEAIKYVSAKGQASFITKLLDNNLLLEAEVEVFLRARNHKSNSHPKNTDIITYKYATGLEALIGYLYLENKINRINELMKYLLEE